MTPIATATNTAGTPIRFARTGTYVSGIATSPDGKAFWVGVNGDGVIDVISTATSDGLGAAMVGTASYAIAFSQDGTTAYVAKSSGSVIPISTATYQAGTPIPAGGDPVAIAVTPAPVPRARAPAFTSPATATAMFGSAFTFTAAASGTPAPRIAKTGTLPAGLSFTDNGNGTASIAGTPAAGSHGRYAVGITASNAWASVTTSMTIVITKGAH